MAELTNAQKAAILIDGVQLQQGTNIASSDEAVASIRNEAAGVYVVGNTPGSTTLTLTVGGRSGSLAVDVTAAPLAVTLGTPEPK